MEKFSLEESEQTLVQDYKDLQALNPHAAELIDAKDLTHTSERQEHNYQRQLPNILEVCWFLNHPLFEGLSRLIKRNLSFWSQSRTAVWIPTAQITKPALFVATINKVNTTHTLYFVEKATDAASAGYAVWLPANNYIKRDYGPTPDDIDAAVSKSQLPRDFFIHSSHWKEFNKYTKRIQIDNLLTGSVYASNNK